MKQITSVEELRAEMAKGNNDFFIGLNFGVKSSKHITDLDDGKFCILNFIDSSEQELSADELYDREITNIGHAMRHGAFYMEDA